MVTFALPEEANKAMQVLDPENRIAYCNPEDENPIQIFKENIQQFLEGLPSDWKDVPLVTLCVLGSDDGNTATFLTNWLIYYYKNGKPKTYSRNIEKGLDFVGASKIRKHKKGRGNGLYLWPDPEFYDEQIYLILHANCQQFEIINVMCALASSVIITFKPSQKDQIVTYLKMASPDSAVPKDTKFIDASSCCLRISAYRNGGGSGIQQAWTTLFDALEKEQPQSKTFQGSMLTPKTFEKFMQDIAANLNAKQFELPDLFGINEKAIEEKPTPEVQAEPESKIRTPEPVEEIPPKPVRQISRHLEKPATNFDPEICNQIYATLEDWIIHRMDISTVDKILDILQSKEVKRAGPQLKSDILGLHSVIKRFNEDLYKMHDNYVCFHGTRDKDHMTWFRNEACKDALKSFNSVTSADQHCSRIFETAKVRLLDLYENDNLLIQDVEIGLANKAANFVTHEYREMLKEYSKLPVTESEFQQIHQRMIEHCVRIIGSAMNYGGRLNNVVRESTKLVTKNLNKTFIRACEKIDFEAVSSLQAIQSSRNIPPISNPLLFYDQLIREALTKHGGSISPEFHQENEQIIRQVLANTSGLDKQELEIRLRTHLGYLDELHEQTQGQPNTEDNPSKIAMLITSHWIWPAVNGKLLKYQLLNYANDKGISSPGFPAEIAWLNNQLVYGHSVKNIPDTEYQGRIINFICDDSNNRDTARGMVTEFFKRIKLEVDDMAKENISRLFLILPSWLDINGRNFLRDCGWAAGFQKTMLFTEPSVSAYYTMWKFPTVKKPYVVVVCLDDNGIRLEIFRHEDVGVQLLTVAYEVWPVVNEGRNSNMNKRVGFSDSKINLEVLHATYGRVIAQIPAKERKLVQHYVLLSEATKWADDLDRYFHSKAGLIKADNIDKGETFLVVFSHFNSNSQQIKKFVSILATVSAQAYNVPE